MATKKTQLRRIRVDRDRLRDVSRVLRARKAREVRCIAYPNRTDPGKRRYSVRDAGRIVCTVVRQLQILPGTPEAEELREELNRCSPCDDRPAKVQDVAETAVVAQAAENGINQNTLILIAVGALLVALLIFLRAAAALPLVAVPLAGLGIRTLISRVATVEGRVALQRAANDGLIVRVKEAANAGVFRRAAGQ